MILWISKDCVGVLRCFWFFHFHVNLKYRRTPGTSTTRLVVWVISAMVEKELGERNFCFDSLKSKLNHDMEEKGIVARVCLEHPCSSGRQSLSSLSPNSFSTMAGITPTTSLVVEVSHQSRQRTRGSLDFSPNGSFTQACVIGLRFMRHNTNSRIIIQITKKWTTIALVRCVNVLCWSHGRSS